MARNRRLSYRPRVERLEDRRLLASCADLSEFADNSDVNDDGVRSPLDVLIVVNDLQNREFTERSDVNGDNRVSPVDALIVLNHLHCDFLFALNAVADVINLPPVEPPDVTPPPVVDPPPVVPPPTPDPPPVVDPPPVIDPPTSGQWPALGLPHSGPFAPGEIINEQQGWWGKGHIHSAIKVPHGQIISGQYNFDMRVVVHDYDVEINMVRICVKSDCEATVRLDPPLQGNLGETQSWNVVVPFDTADYPPGATELRITANGENQEDGSRHFTTARASVIIERDTGSTYRFGSNKFGGAGSWYDLGFSYGTVFVDPAPTGTLSGVVSFNVRNHKSDFLEIVVDRTHFVPEVPGSPWLAQQPSQGFVLKPRGPGHPDFREYELDTTLLADGIHTIAFMVEHDKDGPNGERHLAVDKYWIRIDN